MFYYILLLKIILLEYSRKYIINLNGICEFNGLKKVYRLI